MKNALSLGLLMTLTLGVAGVGAEAKRDCPVGSGGSSVHGIARTDHQSSGNRVIDSCGLIELGTAVDVGLGAVPAWVLPDPSANGMAWLVALRDGVVVRVRAESDRAARMEPGVVARLRPGEPPLIAVSGDGEVEVGSALAEARRFEDPIPDARVVSVGPDVRAVLSGPTDRYPHGVLGDGLEASSVSARLNGDEARLIDVGASAVIEGLSPIIADLDGDQIPELLVTVSDMDQGAMLAAYDLDGDLLATSEPIGQGFRWLHQIGVGATGPNSEVEIIVVRTPHIGGVVEAYRLDGGRLERVASQSGFSSHQLGSPNLDMALLADMDADGRLDIIVPTQDMTTLALLARRGDGFVLLDELALDGHLATNVAAAVDADGWLVLAAGTDDGRLRIFR